MVTAMKTYGSSERCVARETKPPKVWALPVALGRVLRSCLTQNPSCTFSVFLPLLCKNRKTLEFSGIDWRKLSGSCISQGCGFQPHPSLVLTAIDHHTSQKLLGCSFSSSKCWHFTVLLYQNRRKNDRYAFKCEIIPLSESVLQPQQYTEYYKWKFPSSHLFYQILLKTSISHFLLWPLSFWIFLSAVWNLRLLEILCQLEIARVFGT